ncbi:MAG: hypothetical protein ACI8RZ_002700 [Myxococcota bacterium]|jgi:hypothetical protein
MTRANFLIVGAPKCGTTAMTRYLEAHPEVFVAARKDLHYFGSDLNFTRRRRWSEAEYAENFAEAGGASAVGEASVWYLYSKQSAEEIAAYNPDMRIIIMLRQPVDMMHALYTQLRLNGLGDEDLTTFQAALDAEPDRAAGRRIPTHTPLPEALLYRRAARFSEQVRRYQAVFPPEQILVLLQDDLKADTPAAYRRTLSFLGVDPDFQPDLGRVNANKVVRSEGLRRLIALTPASAKGLIPAGLRRGVRKRVAKLNSRHAPREALDPALRALLLAELAPEIEALAGVIDRDLSGWLV